MKKFVSLLCSIAMLFSICTTAFAADVETTEPADVAVMNVNDDGGIAPQAESRGLLYIEDAYVVPNPNGQYNNLGTVKPDAGATLRIWVKNSDGPIKILVMRLGTSLKKVYEEKLSPGEWNEIITTNCTGASYMIGVDGADKAITHYSLLVYQN